jgi:hypothetical protein
VTDGLPPPDGVALVAAPVVGGRLVAVASG